MASGTNGNGETAAAAKEDNVEKAHFNVVGQYIKDFSFENPNAPQTLRGPGDNPNLEIGVNVNAEKIGDNEFEVLIDFKGNAKNDTGVIYNLEMIYAGVFRLENIPNNALRPLLLIDCPALLFPFLRRIVADTTREGGYPPLLLDPIDFAALYRTNMQNEQAEAEKQKPN